MEVKKSRELWLKVGDRNSKFFHPSAIIRRRKFFVNAIKTENGECFMVKKKKINEYFLTKFKELFQEEEVEFLTD